MAALDDLLLEIERGRVTGPTMTAAGIPAGDQDQFQRQVERHEVNPSIAAGVATALGVTAGEASRNLTRRARLKTSGR